MTPPRRPRRSRGPASGSKRAARRPGAPLEETAETADDPSAARAAGLFIEDPLTSSTAEVRRIQPYDAQKQYVCPGCNQEIRRGTGHVVVVPLNTPDLRRHWHDPCLRRARQHGIR